MAALTAGGRTALSSGATRLLARCLTHTVHWGADCLHNPLPWPAAPRVHVPVKAAAASAAAAQHPRWLARSAGDGGGGGTGTTTSSSSSGGGDAGGDDDVQEGLGTLRRRLQQASDRVSEAARVADVPGLRARLAAREREAAADGVWDDAAAGQALMAELADLRGQMADIGRFEAALEEAAFAVELLESDPDCPDAPGLLREALSGLSGLDATLERWELRRLLAGPHDARGAVLTVQAGAGGVDAMDWAEMLERMYTRWAAAQGYKVTVAERSAGEEAGIKSCELLVEGRFAYGLLKGEKGTHRLVRSSPFNAKGLRQTSFAGVEVMPLLEESEGAAPALEIPDKDLEVATMRSGGKGGQNVNKVETGVRMTHIPTGLSVRVTQERTQLANRAIALQRLRAKLLVVLEEQRAAEVAEIRGDAVKAEWGQQIRNYVLHPYKLAKDTRTGHETADVAGLLDGDLEPFTTAYLRLKGRRAAEERLAAAA
ncbi:peptide chain release factor, chloroplastic [Raphidocelis subcapitata]|uniref:Peptide chain release factor, chloroplastic n=1 Tax=Raphidocelis subcapitata TaxID=307507 RepID=A0A2V0NQ99_9CHLO|nr:peptide chain release factor, chloroplastic [Raphidocelis subcapitata]|eukprot:GBF89816.1 peptide chain release factor, chloroplastic [Raphidocelis subcapitata]